MEQVIPGTPPFELTSLEQYEALIGAESVERILAKAEPLRDLHVVNVNSTSYGGGEIPTDLPLVVQVSRFDKWKDPQGAIDAFPEEGAATLRDAVRAPEESSL